MQIGVFLRRGGFEPQFAGFRGHFGGSEPRMRQWVRWIFGKIRRGIIYEVWGAVLVALHKPPETAPFFYFQLVALGCGILLSFMVCPAEMSRKIN